jgi:hypothetical protein
LAQASAAKTHSAGVDRIVSTAAHAGRGREVMSMSPPTVHLTAEPLMTSEITLHAREQRRLYGMDGS